MLDTFSIQNFRLFERLELRGLARVNLFVGKNNTGKSALLEAVHLYSYFREFGAAKVLRLFPTASGQLLSHGYATDPAAVRLIFRGREFPRVGESGLVLGLVNSPEESLALRVDAYQRDRLSPRGNRWLAVEPEDMETLDTEPVPFLVAVTAEKTTRLFDLVDADRFEGVGAPRPYFEQASLGSTQFVSVHPPSASHLASLWDEVSLTPLESEVVRGLQVIEPSIQGLTFVEESRSGQRGRVPLVRTRGSSTPIPLNTMGDGVNRLLEILLSLVRAQGGVLLIDEMENGLHWTVQPDVWSIVFQMAEHLDTQVVATTHSRDCVEGFERVWREDPEAGTFARLDRSDGGIRPIQYDLDTLGDAVATDVEVR